MAEEKGHENNAAEEQTTADSWGEVGRQFETLGESLSRAFRAAWEREETQQHMQSMQDGLERMMKRIDQAVKEARESQQGQKLRAEAEQTAESLRKAGEQTWQEARPQLLAALKKANTELQRFIENIEQRSAADSDLPAQPSSPPPGETDEG
mgnify:CR=1 FL=1